MKRTLLTCFALGLAALFFSVVAPRARSSGLTQVYSNNDFQLTGVTVSKSGRMFVNFPRWSDRYLNAVIEVSGKSENPFPDEFWNRWDGKPETAGKQFVCVQSVVADDNDMLWVVDAAAPLMGPIVQGGPKLVQIDLRTNRVVRVFSFGPDVALATTYLNDVRLDNARHTAYLTDSGAGGIVVVDLTTGKSHRALDKDPSVMAQPGQAIVIDNKPLRDAGGKTPQIDSDGIALSPDGNYLYYQALTSTALYRVKTDILRDPISAKEAGAAAEKIADTFPTDGLWMDKKGNLYLTGLTQNAVVRRTFEGKMQTVVSDTRLQWPDTFTQAPDGSLYVTASHINESPRFNGGKAPAPGPMKFSKSLHEEMGGLYQSPSGPRWRARDDFLDDAVRIDG